MPRVYKRWDPPVGTMFGLWRYLGPGGYRKGARVVRLLCTGCDTEHLRAVQSVRLGLTKRCGACRVRQSRVAPVCRFCGKSTAGKTCPPVSACMACDRRRCRNGTCETCGVPRFSKRGQLWCKDCDPEPEAPPSPPCGACGELVRLCQASPPLCRKCMERGARNGFCCGAARFVIQRCDGCELVKQPRGRLRDACACGGLLVRLLACRACGAVEERAP